jgi:hypothetical protein
VKGCGGVEARVVFVLEVGYFVVVVVVGVCGWVVETEERGLPLFVPSDSCLH